MGMRLIIRLCVVKLIQIKLFLENHVVGRSIIVGKTIFSIGVGLSYEYSPVRMYLRLKSVKQGLLLLRKQQILVGQ